MPNIHDVIAKITTETGLRDWLLVGHNEDGSTSGGGVGSGAEKLSTVAASGTAQTLDFGTASVFDVTLTGNCTLTLTGATASQSDSMTILLRQDSTGSRTVTWPGSVSWLGGSAPTLHTSASSVDVVTLFTVDGGSTWYGFSANSTTTFHGVKAYNSAVQSIANNTNTAVTLDSEKWDTDAYHSTTANTSRITIPVGLGGKYLFTFTSFWASSPTGASLPSVTLKKNGTTNIASASANPGGAGYLPSFAAHVDLVDADYVELIIYQDSGGSINLGHASAADAQLQFSATKIG